MIVPPYLESLIADPTFSLALTQIFGVVMVLLNLDSNEDIIGLSGTYWNYNLLMVKASGQAKL